MKLIFALGNPGSEYTSTRHNVGFLIADEYAVKQGTVFHNKSKLKAGIAECSINGEKILIAKPTTFYNLVGESYRAIIDFYKISSTDTLVIHDELALPFGTIRIREGGSDAGNNGVKSINQHGGEQSVRLRIGVANEMRESLEDTVFVLGRFSKAEAEVFEKTLMPKTFEIIDAFINNSYSVTSHSIL